MATKPEETKRVMFVVVDDNDDDRTRVFISGVWPNTSILAAQEDAENYAKELVEDEECEAECIHIYRGCVDKEFEVVAPTTVTIREKVGC